MEDQVQLVVRGTDGGYLLIESTSKKLHLPTTKLRESEDFKTAAQRCLKQVPCMTQGGKNVATLFFASTKLKSLTLCAFLGGLRQGRDTGNPKNPILQVCRWSDRQTQHTQLPRGHLPRRETVWAATVQWPLFPSLAKARAAES